MRDRLSRLVDHGTFVESFQDAAPYIVTGRATVDGRPVVIIAADPWPHSFADLQDSEKISRAQEMAERLRHPTIYLIAGKDPPPPPQKPAGEAPSGDEAVPPQGTPADTALGFLDRHKSVARVYFHMARLSGLVPQIGVAFGSLGAPAAFPPVMCDALVLLEDTKIAIARRGMVRATLGEDADPEALSGARMHCTKTGLGDALAKSESDAFGWVRRYLSYVPDDCTRAPPRLEPRPAKRSGKSLPEIVPANTNKPFSMMSFIEEIVDAGSALELKELYARELITAFARIEGLPIGIIANNSKERGGILFAESCRKLVRFVSLCDAANLPLLFLADTPGYMVGVQSEQAGLLGSATKVFMAINDATVPKVSVVVRKAYTAGAFAMCGPPFEPEAYLALPSASLTILGPKIADKMIPDRATAERMISQSEDPHAFVRMLIVDSVIELEALRDELALLFSRAHERERNAPGRSEKKHPVWQL